MAASATESQIRRKHSYNTDMGLCQSAQDACMAAQKQAEDGVRAAGGGDALDAAKEKAADGIPIGFGKTFDIPDLATKGGECHVGVKYMCVEGKTVDAQFCAIEFNKKGEKLGSASYEVNETPDGALKYLGDTYGAEGGSEYVSLKLGELGETSRPSSCASTSGTTASWTTTRTSSSCSRPSRARRSCPSAT